MKKLLLSLILLIFPISMCMADTEYSKPSYKVTIERELSSIRINGELYRNCKVIIKASDVQVLGSDFVKVTVIDSSNKKIYQKKFKNHHLYVFRPSGNIQISNGTALISCLFTEDDDDFFLHRFRGRIEEKGIY